MRTPFSNRTENTMAANHTKFRNFDAQFILNTLLSYSTYSRERGGFVRKYARGSIQAGTLVGTLATKGILVVGIHKFMFRLAHLVWVAEHGSWATDDLDHINGDKLDNRITNLRVVDNALNSRNSKMFSNNTSGYTGVSYTSREGKYSAYVWHNQKKHACGNHHTAEAAADARQALIDAHPEWGFTERHGL